MALGYREETDVAGKQCHGVEGKWTDDCTAVMRESPKDLRKIDEIREGGRMVQGDADYVVNPLKTCCMLHARGCQGFRISSALSSSHQIEDHYLSAHKDDPRAKVNRLRYYC